MCQRRPRLLLKNPLGFCPRAPQVCSQTCFHYPSSCFFLSLFCIPSVIASTPFHLVPTSLGSLLKLIYKLCSCSNSSLRSKVLLSLLVRLLGTVIYTLSPLSCSHVLPNPQCFVPVFARSPVGRFQA
jgi:hypothetical protein